MDDPQRTRLTPTSVYRYYDKNGLLLYVGLTNRGTARNSEHNATKEWWCHVVRQEVEHHTSRARAAARERDLISQYRPPFNVQHNPDHAEARAAYLSLIVEDRYDLGRLVSVAEPRRFPMRVEQVARQVVLTSGPDAAIAVSTLSLKNVENLHIGCGGRRARVTHAELLLTGELRLTILLRKAGRCLDASVMFRRPSHNGSSTIKRLDLGFAGDRAARS